MHSCLTFLLSNTPSDMLFDVIFKLVESGGVQAIIHLAQTNISEVKEAVADGLNNLALHPPLHSMIVECGGIKALCRYSRKMALGTKLLLNQATVHQV